MCPTPVDQTILIQEELKRGLRRDDRNVRNQYTLSECKNARPTERGLESAPTVTDPFDIYTDFQTGAELLTNPNFTGSLTGWTAGDAWSYASFGGAAVFDDDSEYDVNARSLSQATTALQNVYYVIRVSFDANAPTDPTLQKGIAVWLDLTIAFPIYSKTAFVGPVNYDFVIKSPVNNPTLLLVGSSGGFASITKVSMFAALYGSWPSPQILRGPTRTLLAFDGEMHTVDESTWSSTSLTLYDGTYYPYPLISNSDFVTQRYWTLASGWTWSDRQLSVSTAGAANATYSDPGSTPIIGYRYRIEIDAVITSGNMVADFGGVAGSVTTGTTVIQGTAVDTDNLELQVSSACVGVVTRVQVWRDETTTDTITGGGGPWDFIDAHGFSVIVNDSNMLLKNAVGSQRTYIMPSTGISSCCDYKGRIFFAGFDGSSERGIWGALPENAVWWSNIGGGNIAEFMRPGLTVAAVKDDLIKRNDSGYSIMPWKGGIKQIRSFSAGILVFGEEGVAGLIQYSDPSPTFGTKNIIDQVGLISRGAACVGRDRAVFVDTSGHVWMINDRFEGERLGYQEYFEPLLAEDIIISYDPHRDEFWFNTPEYSYILNRFGLGEVNKHPTSLNFVDGGLIGVQYYQRTFSVFNSSTALNLDDFETAIDTFDMQLREVKTIHSIEVGITDPTTVEAQLDYRYDKSADYASTAWKTLDDNGIAIFLTSGIEFQLRIRTEDFSETLFDYVKINWRQNRKKSVRELIQANA